MTVIERLQAEVERRWCRTDMPAWPDPHVGGRESFPEEYERMTDPGRYRIVHERARLWAQVLVDHGARAVEVAARPVPAWTDGPPAPVDRILRIDPPAGAEGALPLYLCEADGSVAEASAVVGKDAPVGEPEGEPVEEGEPVREPAEDGEAAPAGPYPPTLRIAWGEPHLLLDMQPDCGCDACDSGSADLLEAVDDTVRHALETTVRLAGTRPRPVRSGDRDWSLTWHEDGSASGSGTMPGGRGLLGLRGRRRHRVDHDPFRRLTTACEQIARGQEPDLPRGTQVALGRAWFPEGRG